MDVAWCLTCSVRMNDPKNPYCSEACSVYDSLSASQSSRSSQIALPVPPPFLEYGSRPFAERRLPNVMPKSPPSTVVPHAVPFYGIKPATLSRAFITHVTDSPVSTEHYRFTQSIGNTQHNRQAFFCSTKTQPELVSSPVGSSALPMTIALRRFTEPTPVIPLSFSRKPISVSSSAAWVTPPIEEGPDGTLRAFTSGQGHLRPLLRGNPESTGGQKVPLKPESVSCRTLEPQGEYHAAPDLVILPPLATSSMVPSPITLPHGCTTSTKSRILASSQTPLSISQSRCYNRKSSQFSFAALVATSVTAPVNREDMAQTSKAVALWPKDTDGQEVEQERGRSRTPRSRRSNCSSLSS